MNTTKNLGLNLPSKSDDVDIDILNQNMSIIDEKSEQWGGE